MVWIVSNRYQNSFGNGTRPAGFVFCETSASDEEIQQAMEKARVSSCLDDLGIKVVLAEDVTKDEAWQAIRNVVEGVCELFSPVEEKTTDVDSENVSTDSIDVLGLSKNDRALLVSAGLDTIQKLIAYGEQNDGLTSVPAMSKNAEKRITKALMKLIRTNEHGS